MKKLFFLFYLVIFSNGMLVAQVSINTDNSAPDGSAMLDINQPVKDCSSPG